MFVLVIVLMFLAQLRVCVKFSRLFWGFFYLLLILVQILEILSALCRLTYISNDNVDHDDDDEVYDCDDDDDLTLDTEIYTEDNC